MRLLFVSIFICSIENIDTGKKNVGHLVLITSPFFGHMIPLLDFGRRLSEYHHVSYIVSASKLDALKQYTSVDENETQSRLKFIGLIDGNDDDYQVVNKVSNIPIHKILQRMQEPLRKLLFSEPNTSTPTFRGRPIDMIITDLFVLSPVWEAHGRNLANYIFIPNSLLSFIRYISIIMDKIKNGTLLSDFDSHINQTISLANGLIFNSIFEIDERILNELRQQSLPGSKMPILFVAPLISKDLDRKQHNDVVVAYVKQWLDAQWKKANKSPSVIYVAFGSWVSLPFEQLIQITNALKPYPIIWSLKKKFQTFLSPLGIDPQQHLLLDWTPQRFILSHPAVRLFISHGGWNSLLESMLAGKPTLVWPFFADQVVNGHRLEHEFGMGRYIQNTDLENGQQFVTTAEITLYLKGMFAREKEYLRNARQIQKIISNAKENSSRMYFEEIIEIIDKQITVRMKKHNEL